MSKWPNEQKIISFWVNIHAKSWYIFESDEISQRMMNAMATPCIARKHIQFEVKEGGGLDE